MAIAYPFESVAPPEGAGERLRAALELVAGMASDVAGMADAELVEVARLTEDVGRIIDALRVRSAGEVGVRSDKALGEDRLSARYGCRSETELMERLTRVPARVVRRRMILDARTRAGSSLTGEVLPARFPHVADALQAGALGVEAADLVAGMLSRVAGRADPAEAAAAEAALVNTATGSADATAATDTDGETAAEPGTDADVVPEADENPATDSNDSPEVSGTGATSGSTFADLKVHTQVWEAYLDQDGPAPDAERASKARGLTLGPVTGGLVPVRGNLMPETASQLTRLLDAHLNPAARNHGQPEPDNNGQATNTGAGSDGELASGPTEITGNPAATAAVVPVDERTPAQKRHDVLAAILTAAARSADTPTIGGDAATLLVHVNVTDLLDPAGVVTLDGIDIPAPTGLAHRVGCAGAIQKIVFDHTGRIIGLGSKERTFTAHQRKAITARDGGCILPGCTLPASWCEIHHVLDYAKGGHTHTDNGVLLCWWHHHNLENSGWVIRMIDGVPEVRAPAWLDPGGVFRPAQNALTRRSRHTRPTDTKPPTPPARSARPESSGTDAGSNSSSGAEAASSNASNGINARGGASGSDSPGGDAVDWGVPVAGDETEAQTAAELEAEFEARWEAAAAASTPETAEERRIAWSAADDPPPWTDDEGPEGGDNENTGEHDTGDDG